jgi:hypothetical protein
MGKSKFAMIRIDSEYQVGLSCTWRMAIARSLLRIGPRAAQHFTDAAESAQILGTAIDLTEGIGYAEAQVLPPLATGSVHLAAAITP